FRFGIVTVVAGAIATAIGGKWADTVRRRTAESAPPDKVDSETVRGLLRICAIGSLIGAPLSMAAFLSPTSGIFFVLVFGNILALFVCTSPINAVVLRSVPEHLRASAMALSIFAIHALGDLWSPLAVGALLDRIPIALAMMT